MLGENRPDYFVGLDLGKSQDYTALVILERHGEGETAKYDARHIQRFPLGTSYPTIVAEVVSLLRREPLNQSSTTLTVDGTGVGAAVVDLFRRECSSGTLKAKLCPVTITGGEKVSQEDDVKRVPKRDLVGVVQVALQTDRLKIAAQLPEAATLTKELQNFQVKITESANDTYGAWREGTHDDLVLALALALWQSQNEVRLFWGWA